MSDGWVGRFVGMLVLGWVVEWVTILCHSVISYSALPFVCAVANDNSGHFLHSKLYIF